MNYISCTRYFFCVVIATLNATHACAAPPVTALTYSPDGVHVVTGSQAGVTVIEATSGKVVRQTEIPMDNVHDLQFSQNGKTLTVVGGNPGESGVIAILAWPGLKKQQQIFAHDDVIMDIDFSKDGSRFVVASADEVCSVFKVGQEEPLARFARHSRDAMAATFLPDNTTIVSASRDETLRVWSSTDAENIRTLHNHSRDVVALALKDTSVGLPVIASAASDLTIRIWQPTIGRMVRFAKLPSEPLCLAWCGDERVIAGCRDGQARVINTQTVQIERTISVTDGWVFSVAVDPTNKNRIALGSTEGKVHTLDLSKDASPGP